MKNKKNRSSGSFVMIFILLFAFCALAFISKWDSPKVTADKKPNSISAEKLRLAQQIMDSIEDYYIVNKNDHKLVKVIRLEKVRVDTIKIKVK